MNMTTWFECEDLCMQTSVILLNDPPCYYGQQK